MTKPQEPKRVHIDSICAGIPSGEFMLAEEALAYAEAVRQEALEEAARLCAANIIVMEKHDRHVGQVYAEQIRKRKEGK